MRSTNAETERRVSTVVKMLASGVQRPQLIEYAAREWGIRQSTVDMYIRKAKDAIKKAVDEEREDFIARKMFQLEEVCFRAAKSQQHGVTVGAIRLQCELVQVLR